MYAGRCKRRVAQGYPHGKRAEFIRTDGEYSSVELVRRNSTSQEIPPLPPRGLVVIIQKEEGSPEKKEPVNVTPRTKIEPQGIGGTNPLRVRITRESDN